MEHLRPWKKKQQQNKLQINDRNESSEKIAISRWLKSFYSLWTLLVRSRQVLGRRHHQESKYIWCVSIVSHSKRKIQIKLVDFWFCCCFFFCFSHCIEKMSLRTNICKDLPVEHTQSSEFLVMPTISMWHHRMKRTKKKYVLFYYHYQNRNWMKEEKKMSLHNLNLSISDVYIIWWSRINCEWAANKKFFFHLW